MPRRASHHKELGERQDMESQSLRKEPTLLTELLSKFFPRSREMMPHYISVRGKCSPQHSSFLDLKGLTSACPVLFVCMEKMHLR